MIAARAARWDDREVMGSGCFGNDGYQQIWNTRNGTSEGVDHQTRGSRVRSRMACPEDSHEDIPGRTKNKRKEEECRHSVGAGAG